jgi:hypothetical protein
MLCMAEAFLFSVAETAFLFLISHKIFYRFLGDLLIEYYYGGGILNLTAEYTICSASSIFTMLGGIL